MIRNLLNSVLLLIISFSLNNAQSLNGNDVNTSSMAALNMINVTIGGDFPMSGSYPASRTERVDQLVTRIIVQYRSELLSTTPDEELLGLIKSNIDDFAKRNIILKRLSGELINIDLVKFRQTGDFGYNPYLNNDDVLIFPPLDLERNFVQISGAVNKETKFEFVEGEKLSDAIEIAYGINPAFENINQASISRLSNNGSIETELIVDLSDNPILQRGDRIRILSDEYKKQDYSVLILGEVKNPGRVFITRNNTTINEIIQKAGGLTEGASLKFAELIRGLDSYSTLKKEMVEENFNGNVTEVNNFMVNLRQLEYLKMYRAADLVMGDTLFFGIDNQLRGLSGFSQLDFRNLSDSSSYESKYKLADNDVIIIPQATDEVYVWGGVKRVGNYEFQSDLSVWDYIDQAGGLTEIAYGYDEVYLIKGKTRDWIHVGEDQALKVESGDYIYVKKEVPRDTGYYIYRVAQYASIIGSVATVILLLNQFGK